MSKMKKKNITKTFRSVIIHDIQTILTSFVIQYDSYYNLVNRKGFTNTNIQIPSRDSKLAV